MKKNILIAFLVVVVLLLGAMLWKNTVSISKSGQPSTTTQNSTSQKDTKQSDDIYNLVQSLSANADVRAGKVLWIEESGTFYYSGYESSFPDSKNAPDFSSELKNHGFTVDYSESTDGTMVGSYGMAKGDIICRVTSRYTGTVEQSENDVKAPESVLLGCAHKVNPIQ